MVVSSNILRPFWRYFGGKWRATPSYPAPVHDTIVEPFAGAAGYALHYPERDVILVDCYPVVAEIWRWLIAVTPDEVHAIPLVDSVDVPGRCGVRSLPGPRSTAEGSAKDNSKARHMIYFTSPRGCLSPHSMHLSHA
jgi:hypothetical protein